MPRHCFKKDNKSDWKVYTRGCLDTSKYNRYMGTVHTRLTQEDLRKIEFLVEEFNKYGFRIKFEQRAPQTYYLYTDRKEHPTCASRMVGVALGRHIQYDLDKFYYMYTTLKPHFNFCTTVGFVCYSSKSETSKMMYLDSTSVFRSRPNRNSKTRNNGMFNKPLMYEDYHKYMRPQREYYNRLRTQLISETPNIKKIKEYYGKYYDRVLQYRKRS